MEFGTSLKKILSIDASRFRVELEYDDGFRGTVDLTFLFASPASRPLVLEIVRGDLFDRCFVESGALAWPNGYELCPDALRRWIAREKVVA